MKSSNFKLFIITLVLLLFISDVVGEGESPPAIINWGNNITNDDSTSISTTTSQSIRFNITTNQTITSITWVKVNP